MIVMRYLKKPLQLLIPALFALLLSTSTGNAQNLLAFTPNGFSGWNDTVYADSNNTTLCAGFLKNYSPNDTFLDSLLIQGIIDTGQFVYFSYPLYSLYPNFRINPGDSAALLISFDVTTPPFGGQFHVGNNVVVVWPIGVGPGNWQPGDSVVLNVFIIDTLTSIGEHAASFLRIFPVPTNGPLYVSSINAQHQIATLTIRDTQGRIVYQGIPSSPINTEGWASGIYMMEATLTNGTVGWYKIMRQ